MDFHKSLFWIFFIIIMKITFIVCDLNQQSDFQIPRINTTLKGRDPVRHFGPAICNNIPIEIISIKNFDAFKTEIIKWKMTNF